MTIEFKKPLGMRPSKSSKIQKNIFIVLFTVILFLLVIVATLLIFLLSTSYYNQKNDTKNSENQICNTKACIKAGKYLLYTGMEKKEKAEKYNKNNFIKY